MSKAPDFLGEYSQKVFEIAEKFEPVLCYDFNGSKTVQGVEALFREKINSLYPILVSSGTMAFYACILALELKQGEEVLLPVNICQSIANMVILAGLIPVFVDIEDNLCMNLEDLKKKITPNSKLVLFVHAYGYPMDLGEIIQFCHKLGLMVIEDCAQAPGAMINQHLVGHSGDMTIYSFGQNKPISAGGGGMVCTEDEELAHKLRIVAREGAVDYPNFLRLGINMSINELHAFLIYYWIEHFDFYLAKKMEKVKLYNQVFKGKMAYLGEKCGQQHGCRHIFHKYIVELPFGNNKEKYTRFIDALFYKYGNKIGKIAQPALPNPPFKVEYVNRYLEQMGRSDLADLGHETYTGWESTQYRYLYLSTHHLLEESMMLEVSQEIVKELQDIG